MICYYYHHLIDYYLNCKEALGEGQKKYISRRIANMADSQLGTLLLFDISKEQKNKVKEYIYKMKTVSSDISAEFKKSKKYKSLIYSNFLLYSTISKIYKRKEG